jgi:hypothetical protein
MQYLYFFLILIPAQLLLVAAAIRLFGKRRQQSWLGLMGTVFLLMIAVNGFSIIPYVGPLVAVVFWLVALQRLSGLDTLSTFILAFSLGVICFVGAVVLARRLEIPLL